MPNEQPGDILDYYLKRMETMQQRLRELSVRWGWFGYLRGGLFLLSLLPLGFAVSAMGGVSIPWVMLFGLIFVLFLVTAYFHEGMIAEIRTAKLMSEMHRESVARLRRDWRNIEVPEFDVPTEFVPVATDLDLFGDQSLYKLLGTVRTPLGIEILGQWIIDGADKGEIELRQSAVAELAPDRAWREKFRLICAQLAASRSGPSQFVDWSTSENWFHGRDWLLRLCQLTGGVSAGSILLLITGVLPLTVVGPTLIVTVIVNFFLSVFFAGSMHDVFNQISTHQDEISQYGSLFGMIGEFNAKSSYLKAIQKELSEGDMDVRRHVASLSRLTWLANIRRNGVLFIAYLMLEFLVMWDAHILSMLEKWKTRHGKKAKSWFNALGRWESILALSKLAADNPTWTFPTVRRQSPGDGESKIDCVKLGHPLMDDSRVPNDVIVGPPGTVLLVTGSNMSGKSTLLRSIGVNVVLAQMGSVVCAEQMSHPPLHIETSMRIVDSLADGVSFFMAELKRLKYVVDQAKKHYRAGERTMLFLLDEILQGTNSRERQIAVSRVVRNLIDQNAIGAISTHDLDLARTPELERACRSVHFSEQFIDVDGQRKMTFDYKMKQGVAETTNALKLLEMVGLVEPDKISK